MKDQEQNKNRNLSEENLRPQLLSSQDLHHKLQSLIQQERKLTNEILQHIHEVDQRKLYLKMELSV